MGEVTDIGDLLGKALHERRMAWVKPLVAGLCSAAVTIIGVTWQVRGYVDKLEHVIEGQQKQIELLEQKVAPVPSIQQTAINAQASADKVTAMLFAHLGGYPKETR